MNVINDEPTAAFPDGKLKEGPPLYSGMLNDILGVTRSDLLQNRMGRLAPSQTERFQQALKSEVDGMWLMLSIFLGVSVVIALIMFPSGAYTAPMLLTMGAFIGGFMLFIARRQAKAKRVASTLRIKQTAGVPQLVGSGNRLKVGDMLLEITPEQFRQLMPYDLPYMRVYFTQNEQVVVGAELFGEDDDEKVKNSLEDDDAVVTLSADSVRPTTRSAQQD